MNRRIDAHPLNPTNHLGNLALVDWPQPCPSRVNNLPRRGGKFLNKRKILHQTSAIDLQVSNWSRTSTYLVHIQWPNSQCINNITTPRRPLSPLLHLHGTQIMRRVHIARFPPPRHLLQVVGRVFGVPQRLDGLESAPVLLVGVALHHLGGRFAGAHVASRGGALVSVVADGEEVAAGGGCRGSRSVRGVRSLAGRRCD